MSVIFRQVIENIGKLSSEERAMVAHCLISSLEGQPEDGVDDAWVELAEKRFSELESGTVRGASWQDVKSVVKG
jgi:hypothetical protein